MTKSIFVCIRKFENKTITTTNWTEWIEIGIIAFKSSGVFECFNAIEKVTTFGFDSLTITSRTKQAKRSEQTKNSLRNCKIRLDDWPVVFERDRLPNMKN